MNAQEYLFARKIVEYLNIIRQYSRTLREPVQKELFFRDGWNMTIDLEELSKHIVEVLDRTETIEQNRIAAQLDLASLIEAYPVEMAGLKGVLDEHL